MLSMALLAKGFSANSTKTDEINQAVEHIHHAKKDPHFIGFDPSEISRDKVLAKIDWAAIVFNGEAMDAINEDSTLQYAIPKEGSFMWRPYGIPARPGRRLQALRCSLDNRQDALNNEARVFSKFAVAIKGPL